MVYSVVWFFFFKLNCIGSLYNLNSNRFVSNMGCKDFLPVYGLSSILLMGSFGFFGFLLEKMLKLI